MPLMSGGLMSSVCLPSMDSSGRAKLDYPPQFDGRTGPFQLVVEAGVRVVQIRSDRGVTGPCVCPVRRKHRDLPGLACQRVQERQNGRPRLIVPCENDVLHAELTKALEAVRSPELVVANIDLVLIEASVAEMRTVDTTARDRDRARAAW